MGWDGPMTYEQYLAWLEWLQMDFDVPSRADMYELNTASHVAGKDLEPLKFNRSAQQQIPSTPPRYHSATDDPAYYWEPKPLDEEEFVRLQQKLMRHRAKRRGN